MNLFVKVCFFLFIALKSKDTDVAYFSWTFPPNKKVKLLSPHISFVYPAGQKL